MAKRNKTAKTKTNNTPKSLQTRNNEEVVESLAAVPSAFVRRFSEEMNNLFADFGHGRDLLAPIIGETDLPPGLWAPQVEVFERGKELVLRADLPGVTKEDVNVELSENGITLEGERKTEQEESGEGFYRSERSYGKFYRRVPLPEGVNPEEAKATFRDGVLEVTMPAPNRGERKSRRLEIAGDRPQRAAKKAAA
ncbi:MAG: Hsp20/alpha crystallin family protein [Pyrinomonadaceae bacterium]